VITSSVTRVTAPSKRERLPCFKSGSVHPSVEIQFRVNESSDTAEKSLTFEVPKYRALFPDQIDALMVSVIKLNPRQSDLPTFRDSQLARWATSNGTLHNYVTKDYPKWLETVRGRLENLAEDLHYKWTTPCLFVELKCTGGVPANSVHVWLRAKGNVVLHTPGQQWSKQSQERLRLLQPPRLNPYPNRPLSSFDPSLLSFASKTPPRDKNKFYRVADSELGWEFSCEEFMHHSSHEISFALSPRNYSDDEAKGAIECEIQGTNIRDPITDSIPVRFKFLDTATLPVAEDLALERNKDLHEGAI
jgi:hypothetical protein